MKHFIPLVFFFSICTYLPAQMVGPNASQPIPGLFNTGVDESGATLADYSVDTHWQITSPAGTAAVVKVMGAWTNPVGAAKWIAPLSTTGPVTYVYTLTFDLSGYKPETARIEGLIAADDHYSLYLNDELIDSRQSAWYETTSFEASAGFRAGINKLQVFVEEPYSGAATGLLIEGIHGTASLDGAISLNGIDAYASFYASDAPVEGSTWEAWVRIPNYIDEPAPGHNPHWPVLYRWGMYSSCAFHLHSWDGSIAEDSPAGYCSSHSNSAGAGTIPEEKWTHVAIVYHGQECDMFVDGRFIQTSNYQCSQWYSTWEIDLGARGYIGMDNFFTGEIDSVRISNTQRYLSDFTPERDYENDASTWGLWHFDEGAGSVAYDSSGNNHHFNLHGGYSWVEGNTSWNSSPEAIDDYAQTELDTLVDIDCLQNDSDTDGDSLSILQVTPPSHGVASIQGALIQYQPEVGFVGLDQFDYTIGEGNCGEATATVYLEVYQPNWPPTANDDYGWTYPDRPILISVIENDFDQNGDPLTLISASSPNDGVIEIQGNEVLYSPNNGFLGVDNFSYSVSDGQGAEASASVFVTVDYNQAPQANYDSANTDQNVAVWVDLTENDTDVDENMLPETVTVTQNPSNGTVVNHADGSVTYTPDPNFYGNDSFAYRVSDAFGAWSNSATVGIEIDAVANNGPTAIYDSATVVASGMVVVDVLMNDYASVGYSLDAASVVLVQDGAKGSAVVHHDGTLTYTPAVGIHVGSGTTDTLNYKVADTTGLYSNIATVEIKIEPTVNNASAFHPFRVCRPNLVGGVTTKLRVENAEPGHLIRFAWSMSSTSSALLFPRALGMAVADASGVAELTIHVPLQAIGLVAYLQAIDLENSELTTPIEVTVR